MSRLRVRRRALAAAVAAAVAVVVAGCDSSAPDTTQTTGTRATASSSTQQNAPSPTLDREQALADLLARRADAVRTRDRAAYLATLDDPKSGFGLRQLAQFDALSTLPLAEFAYGTPEPAPALGADRVAQLGPDAWAARVNGRYRLKGYDSRSRDFESYFTAVRRDGQWRLADDTDGGTQTQLWDLPSFAMVTGKSTLVVGTGPASRLRPYAALGDLAVKRVTAVWGTAWARRLVIVVPRDAATMAELVGQDPKSVAQVAAVTDGPFDPDGYAGADRVVVNPGAFGTLERRGQQVVLTHEGTHVAIRATTNRPVPLWLSEGMADYVGYRDIDATPQQVAAALFAKVRAGTGPRTLPVAADFDPGRTTIGPNYNAAWLAVRRIAERWGVPTLVRFYRAVATAPAGASGSAGSAGSAAGTTPEEADAAAAAAFRSVLHITVPAFTKDWLAYLRTLAAR
jgi:hypothetical protein